MPQWEYDPEKHGIVTAIRIYEEYPNSQNVKADLALYFGGLVTIDWLNPEHRERYKKGINGYTYIYDERLRPYFDEFVRSWE